MSTKKLTAHNVLMCLFLVYVCRSTIINGTVKHDKYAKISVFLQNKPTSSDNGICKFTKRPQNWSRKAVICDSCIPVTYKTKVYPRRSVLFYWLSLVVFLCKQRFILRRLSNMDFCLLQVFAVISVLCFERIIAICPTVYGEQPCLFTPAPPGKTPACARPGLTYCEHPSNYPG